MVLIEFGVEVYEEFERHLINFQKNYTVYLNIIEIKIFNIENNSQILVLNLYWIPWSWASLSQASKFTKDRNQEPFWLSQQLIHFEGSLIWKLYEERNFLNSSTQISQRFEITVRIFDIFSLSSYWNPCNKPVECLWDRVEMERIKLDRWPKTFWFDGLFKNFKCWFRSFWILFSFRKKYFPHISPFWLIFILEQILFNTIKPSSELISQQKRPHPVGFSFLQSLKSILYFLKCQPAQCLNQTLRLRIRFFKDLHSFNKAILSWFFCILFFFKRLTSSPFRKFPDDITKIDIGSSFLFNLLTFKRILIDFKLASGFELATIFSH